MASFNNLNLTPDQQRLVTMYINQYNQTNTHVELLLNMLDEISDNIINIITPPRRYSGNRRHINRNLHQNLNNLQNNFIRYDYENPINRSTYNHFNMPPNNNSSRRNNTIFDNYLTGNSPNISNANTSNATILTSFLTNFLNTSVPIRPTTEDIQNASRIVRYGDIQSPLSESCPISLDEFNNDDLVRQLLPCRHIFHQPQFQEWFENNVMCPVCRYDIRNYNGINDSTNQDPLEHNVPSNQPPSNTTIPSNQTPSNATIPSNQTPSNTTIPSNQTDNVFINGIPSVSNVSIVREPLSNQIEHISFDIDDQLFTNSFLDRVTRNVFQSILNTNTQNNNDRIMIDPSNNIIFYENIQTNNHTTNN